MYPDSSTLHAESSARGTVRDVRKTGFLLATVVVLLASSLNAGPARGVTNPDGFKQAGDWMASLWVKDTAGGPDRRICGAALVAPQWVVTAAHCVAFGDIAYARLGEGTSGAKLEVVARLWHQRYNKDSYVNDVGLVKLAQPVDVTPVALPPKADEALRAVENLSVMGWGEDQNGLTPGTLAFARQVDMSNQGETFFTTFNPLLQIAAGRYMDRERVYSGACRGDSGGPLVATFGTTEVLVGVVSYGATDCNAANPTAYTRISAYLDWLDQAFRSA
jgi:secreted trypsin-like serine protease